MLQFLMAFGNNIRLLLLEQTNSRFNLYLTFDFGMPITKTPQVSNKKGGILGKRRRRRARVAQPSEVICHYPNNQFEFMSNHFLNFLLIKHVVSCGGGKDDYRFLI